MLIHGQETEVLVMYTLCIAIYLCLLDHLAKDERDAESCFSLIGLIVCHSFTLKYSVTVLVFTSIRTSVYGHALTEEVFAGYQ